MSRYISTVLTSKAEKVFKSYIGNHVDSPAVQVVHGFDAPCTSYFCDLMPECEEGIYYGGIGLTTRLSKWDYIAALKELGLNTAADAVALDIPY